MSFITKRERVFNEYDIFDLPARNEGKLKAYASCTDARAWSHFCSDKSEHLVEVIKRNNETVRPKYIPTEIIVSTLMISKNAEIARLKRKIGEFEQMLAAYDQLDLTCDQKCDIANAHAAIRAANKELDEMSLDLDLSGFTEGIDSEAFETGKSRGDELRFTGIETGKSGGDEWNAQKQSTPRMETKSNQFGASCTRDATTSAYDTRIDELQGTIISKDAKLSAMQNTIAVMENDVCEPYCVYAHIYTALEKIFGTLCQNEKYKEYLELLTAGKDTRGIDIKGKILFKLKVLEKFSLALIAPCSQGQYNSSDDCACYHAEIVTHVETTFALTSAENPNLDSKRAHLIADIMQNEDMKEILSKESLSTKTDDEQLDECYIIDGYNINQENLKRLKNLQANYDDLLNSYDHLKHERDCLNARCQKYAELENECKCLQNKLREYNELWKEKEYYRNRSEDLDNLKENFLILTDETKGIETKLKAEQEINKVKSKTVDDLRNDNIKLNNKLTEVSLVCEKQKNSLICKLKEKECKLMCQEQQIRSLSIQIDNLLDNNNTNNISTNENESQSLVLNDEIESQKEQIKNLKDALCCNEEEKLYYKQEFEKQLEIINKLKFEVEDWKSKYEKEMQNNNSLEKYLKEYQIDLDNTKERNNALLSTELEQKATIENLNDIIHNKSQEISYLIDEVNKKEEENLSLLKEIQSIKGSYNQSLNLFKNEKKAAVYSIRSVRQESLELLQSTKSYMNIKEDISGQNFCKGLNETEESDILKEIQLLREINLENIDILRRENTELKKSFDVAQEQTEKLKINAINQEELLKKIEQLSQSHENLLHEKAILQHDLNNKSNEANKLLHAFELTNKKSEHLMDCLHESENLQKQHLKLSESYQKIVAEKNDLQKNMLRLEKVSEELNESQKIIKEQNQRLHTKEQQVSDLEIALLDLNNKYDQLQRADYILQRDYDENYSELNKISSELDNKIKENQNLTNNLNILKSQEATLANNLETLKRENLGMQSDLALIKNERKELIDRQKFYENLESKYFDLEEAHHQVSLEKQKLQKEIEMKLEDLKKLEQNNNNLNIQNENLLIHNNDLEEALIRTRNELLKFDSLTISYENIKAEIDALKSEKISSHKRICDSQDKIDELEYHIHDLNEDILAKDKKIITLENYINNLEDEIRKLQNNLDEVVDSGEEMRKLSYEKMAQTQKMLKAHYSKATHNIKMEVAKLENDKSVLEEQLSMSKLITHDSSNEKHIYISQVNKLNEDRKRIVSYIRQLELQVFEESILNPSNCTSENVIESLQKIGKYLYKNMSLEKILLSVQSSYDILKSKADEAKTIAEKERQKIIAEKEEMQKERKNIERTLENYKTKLEEDKTVYENNIRDLEGEMLNQALLFDKMKQMQENEILKLKNDKLSLQHLHENISVQLKDLQDKLNNEYKENSMKQKAFEQAMLDVKEKDKQVLSLLTQINNLRNKPKKDYGIQTYSEITKDVATETHTGKQEKTIISVESYVNFERSSKPSVDSEIKNENEEHKNLNINFIKLMYSNYKSKRLSLGNFEQYSIDGINLIKENFKEVSTNTMENLPLRKSNHSPLATKDSLVNIYNTTKSADSTKCTNDSDNYDSINKTESINSSHLTGLTLNSDIFKSKNESYNNATSDKAIEPADKDMFMIYKDSHTSSGTHTYAENRLWPQKGYTNVLVERATFHTDKIHPFHTKTKDTAKEMQADYDTLDSANGKSDDDSLKPRLNINLPRVYTDNISTVSLSEYDRNSNDSYTRDIYVSQQRRVRSDTNISIKTSKTKKVNTIPAINHYGDKNNNLNRNITSTVQNKEKESQYFIPYIKSNTNVIREAPTKTHVMKAESFLTDQSDDKLKNINTAQSDLLSQHKTLKENNISNGTKTMNENIHIFQISNNSDCNKELYESQSDKTISVSDQRNKFKESDLFKELSTEVSNISSSLKQPKPLIDRSVYVKLDSIEYYENHIQQLNKALENLERDYKNKINAIKVQYDSNVNLIINKHNQGVESIQSLHEERLSDIINTHENEIESLRTLGIEALRKVKRLENENHYLKSKIGSQDTTLDEIPVKIPTPEVKKKRIKCRLDDKTLTKTGVVISNLPKRRSQGPCTCTIDFNVSDTIRNIFDQVDIDHRKMAEQTYLKYIANKILNDNVEVLDAQELSFLHLKVCRQWKIRLSKEGTLQKRIESLESELINKKRQTHQHMAELDRKVEEEWQRLQEVREAVCFSPNKSDENILNPISDRDIINVKSVSCNTAYGERPGRSLEVETPNIQKPKRVRESNRTILVKQDVDDRKEKTPCNHEAPTRLKRFHDRRSHRK